MDEQEFKRRTKEIALRVIKLVEALPAGRVGDVIGRQLIRCATSVGANYRAVCRSRSHADMISRLSIVEEEADESIYWLDLLAESGLIPARKLEALVEEIDEIIAMTVASIKTLRSRNVSSPKSKIQNPK